MAGVGKKTDKAQRPKASADQRRAQQQRQLARAALRYPVRQEFECGCGDRVSMRQRRETIEGKRVCHRCANEWRAIRKLEV